MRFSRSTATLALLLALGLTVAVVWNSIQYIRHLTRYADLLPEARLLILPPVRKHEAIVVLTGERGRIPDAVDLLRNRPSDKLIISGVHQGTPLVDIVNKQVGVSYLIHETWRKIEVEEKSVSTQQNAEFIGPYLDRNGIRYVILVTSDYHMPRAIQIFRGAYPDIEFIEYPVGSVVSDTLFFGQGLSKEAITKLFTEFGKFLLYKWTPKT